MKPLNNFLLFVLVICLNSCGGKNSSDEKTNIQSSASSTSSSASDSFSYREVTNDDLTKVKESWKARDLSVKDARVAYENDNGNYHVQIYEHKVGTRKHFGLIATPLKTQQQKLPIEVQLAGFSESDFSVGVDDSIKYFTDDAILVIPAFRGQTLKYNGMSFSAEGDAFDSFDGAADDTIALLNVVEEKFSIADFNRLLVSGYSRGANVAFLLGVRDPRVDAIVAVAAPVDFYRQETRTLLPDLIQKEFFNGKTADETRQAMLASSPVRFDILPNVKKVFLFQATGDLTVPQWNAQEINTHLLAQKIDVDFYLYQGYGHGEIWSNQDFINTWAQVQANFLNKSTVNNWQLAWSDEFDGTQLDTTKWAYDQICQNAGVELQCYTNRTNNVSVSDGKLHLIARKETFTGPLWGDETKSITQDYTSGHIQSLAGKLTYGRMEVRAKMPQGKGVGPAIWMMPFSQSKNAAGKYGEWPASGEIDILEVFSPNTGGSSGDIHGTLIYGEAWPGTRAATGNAHTPAANVWDNYHVYALEWEDGEMRWYFDDVHYATQTKNGWFTFYGPKGEKKFSEKGEPFDQDFYLILNVAITGVTDPTFISQEMTVDYVRVYQCPFDKLTGKGCATNVNTAVTPTTETPKKSLKLFADGTRNFDAPNKSTSIITNADTGIVSNPDLSDSTGTLWDLQFNQWPKQASLNWEDKSDSTHPTHNFTLGAMSNLGQIKFDIFVESMDETTNLNVKMDSGSGNNSYYTLKALKKNEWQSIAVPLANLIPGSTGAVRFGSVISPFVIEAEGGKAHIKLNNIRLECIGANCGFTPIIPGKTLTESFNIFIDAVDPIWTRGLNIYNEPESTQMLQSAIVDATAENHGKVLDLKWGDALDQNGLAYIESIDAKDATAFSTTGYINFDIKVLSYGKNKTGFEYYVWCGFPCGDKGPVPEVPDDKQWHNITIPVSRYVNFGLDLQKLTNPFVFAPVWGDQRGVHVQLDNIRWVNP